MADSHPIDPAWLRQYQERTGTTETDSATLRNAYRQHLFRQRQKANPLRNVDLDDALRNVSEDDVYDFIASYLGCPDVGDDVLAKVVGDALAIRAIIRSTTVVDGDEVVRSVEMFAKYDEEVSKLTGALKDRGETHRSNWVSTRCLGKG